VLKLKNGKILPPPLVASSRLAENLGPDPIAFAQFQMDASGALNVLRRLTRDRLGTAARSKRSRPRGAERMLPAEIQ
jgi:hypothetical protein